MQILGLVLLLAAHGTALVLRSPVTTSPVTVCTVSTSIRVASPAYMMAKKTVKSKSVQVLLDADVEGVGEKGALVELKPAYAENVVVAKGLGAIATPEQIAQLAKELEEQMAKAAAAKQTALKAKETMAGKFAKGLVIEVQMKDGEITESVTSQSIADVLKRASVDVQAADIAMPDVTELGSFSAQVTLHPDVVSSLKVVVEKSKITFI